LLERIFWLAIFAEAAMCIVGGANVLRVSCDSPVAGWIIVMGVASALKFSCALHVFDDSCGAERRGRCERFWDKLRARRHAFSNLALIGCWVALLVVFNLRNICDSRLTGLGLAAILLPALALILPFLCWRLCTQAIRRMPSSFAATVRPVPAGSIPTALPSMTVESALPAMSAESNLPVVNAQSVV
jgi:hypothetical protein